MKKWQEVFINGIVNLSIVFIGAGAVTIFIEQKSFSIAIAFLVWGVVMFGSSLYVAKKIDKED
jgi:hypothetical protein